MEDMALVLLVLLLLQYKGPYGTAQQSYSTLYCPTVISGQQNIDTPSVIDSKELGAGSRNETQ